MEDWIGQFRTLTLRKGTKHTKKGTREKKLNGAPSIRSDFVIMITPFYSHFYNYPR